MAKKDSLTFAVDFVTDQAERSLSSLVSTVKANTTDLVQNVLAPLSPSNLVTQIAQQGAGINSLAGNLVQGGIGALANSSYGYLAQQGAQFNAENSALNQTISDARRNASLGLPMSDDMIRFIYQTNLANAKAQEEAELRIKRGIGVDVARGEAAKTLGNGSRAWDDAVNDLSESTAARFWAENGFFGGLGRFWDAMINVKGSGESRGYSGLGR